MIQELLKLLIYILFAVLIIELLFGLGGKS